MSSCARASCFFFFFFEFEKFPSDPSQIEREKDKGIRGNE